MTRLWKDYNDLLDPRVPPATELELDEMKRHATERALLPKAALSQLVNGHGNA